MCLEGFVFFLICLQKLEDGRKHGSKSLIWMLCLICCSKICLNFFLALLGNDSFLWTPNVEVCYAAWWNLDPKCAPRLKTVLISVWTFLISLGVWANRISLHYPRLPISAMPHWRSCCFDLHQHESDVVIEYHNSTISIIH